MDHGRLLKSLFITPFGGLEMGSWRGISKALPSRHKSHSPDKNDQNHKKTLSEKQVTCQIWNQQSFIPRTSRSRGTMVIVKSPKMSDKAELRCCVNTPPRMRSHGARNMASGHCPVLVKGVWKFSWKSGLYFNMKTFSLGIGIPIINIKTVISL